MESAAARPPHCVAGRDTLSRRRPSIFGTVGHAFDSALAEPPIGLYKNACVRPDAPSDAGRSAASGDVELITADYVSWYNQQRLRHRLGRVPSAEAETATMPNT